MIPALHSLTEAHWVTFDFKLSHLQDYIDGTSQYSINQPLRKFFHRLISRKIYGLCSLWYQHIHKYKDIWKIRIYTQYCFQYTSTCPVFHFSIWHNFSCSYCMDWNKSHGYRRRIVMKRSQWLLPLLCVPDVSSPAPKPTRKYNRIVLKDLQQCSCLPWGWLETNCNIPMSINDENYVYVSSKRTSPHWTKDHMGKNNFRMKIHGPQRYVLWVTGVT